MTMGPALGAEIGPVAAMASTLVSAFITTG